MSEDDFKNDDTAKSAKAWLTGLIDVWSDGKGETDEIVREWSDTWKSLTEDTRTELQALQASAKEAGYTGVADQIQADIDSLDSMDREISDLLKKRQNGYLTDDEKVRLQELIDNREAIIIRYKLQPDSDTEGFQTILDKVEAEVARAQARGLQDADVSVYQNAIVAAAQGMATLNSQIDAQYDSEYALIQLMEEGAEKEAALAQLNTSYNEQRQAAVREYAQTLAQLVNPVWNDEGMKQTGDTLSDLAGKLTMYDAAVKTYAARYLTEEAQGGIVAGNTRNDNRQTFHSQSSVNLTGNSFYIRSDQDIHDLAVEIATLTRTEQRGRGLRAT